jgi:hypothetical protein
MGGDGVAPGGSRTAGAIAAGTADAGAWRHASERQKVKPRAAAKLTNAMAGVTKRSAMAIDRKRQTLRFVDVRLRLGVIRAVPPAAAQCHKQGRGIRKPAATRLLKIGNGLRLSLFGIQLIEIGDGSML